MNYTTNDSIAKGGGGTSAEGEYYLNNSLHGNYQYISLEEIIGNFTAAYVGENKILASVLDGDVSFHAHRALQELSYDTLKSCKTQEIVLPPSLQMILPHDYVNYTKVTWSDSNGIEHIIYPTSKTGNHNTIQQYEDGSYKYAQGKNKFNSKLVQDNTPTSNDQIKGYRIKKDFGWNSSADRITSSYSGPWRLFQEYVYKYSTGSVVTENNKQTEIVIKAGMEVKHVSLPAGTTVTSVELVLDPVLGVPVTEFYLSNPTYPSEASDGLTGLALKNTRYLWFDDITSDSTWGKYKSSGSGSVGITDPLNPATDNSNYFTNTGERYGLDPQYAQSNGSFFINCDSGKIHFSSNLSGKTIVLHYLSDHHGNEGEEIIHKFAEEAMYKWIAYGCAQARTDVPPQITERLKREKSAETRKAKIRLSNIKIEEISQIMRGKSKFLDH